LSVKAAFETLRSHCVDTTDLLEPSTLRTDVKGQIVAACTKYYQDGPSRNLPCSCPAGFWVPPGQLTVYGPAAVTSGATGLVKYFCPVLHSQIILPGLGWDSPRWHPTNGVGNCQARPGGSTVCCCLCFRGSSTVLGEVVRTRTLPGESTLPGPLQR
jgi:hypothetical protein